MARTALVRPAGTAWGAVLGGWIASIGAMALLAPAIGTLLANARVGTNDLAPAVPVVLGLFLAYLIGGYVAGRMAGYRTSWHGMMTAFLSLFVVLVLMLAGYAADRGLLAVTGVESLADVIPGVRDLDITTSGNAATFGALLGFLGSIFAGWLGGVLAPSHAVAATVPAAGTVERVEKREVVRERRPLMPAPTIGRKGEERLSR